MFAKLFPDTRLRTAAALHHLGSATMLRSLFIVFVLSVAPLAAAPAIAQSLPDWAAPVEPSEPVEAPPPVESVPNPPPAPVPVDGGLALLALAGGAFALRRLRRSA